jgi:thiol-disulfide isomerase/thioredoxin
MNQAIIITVVIVIIILIIYFTTNKTTTFVSYNNFDNFDNNRYIKSHLDAPTTDLLTRSGWKLYVNNWCGLCDTQIDIIKQLYPDFLNVEGNVIRTSSITLDFNDPKLIYPYWVNSITGAEKKGLQNKDTVIEMAMGSVDKSNVTYDLVQTGWVMYASEWCGYCKQQIDILKTFSPAFVNDKRNVIYNAKDVSVFPTWINKKTNDKKLGLQTLEKLREMAAIY